MSRELVTFKIQGMTCVNCATGIEKRFQEKDGILSREVDFQKGEGTFEYDGSIIHKEEIIEIVEKGNSYKVTSEIKGNAGENARFDLIIIGGGSAAFAAAIKADELGKRTMMVNGGLPIGGTCVNVGCVPSKFLIRAAEQVHRSSQSNFEGIESQNSVVEFSKVIQEKKALVEAMRKKKYLSIADELPNLVMLKGFARFVGVNEIEIGDTKYKAEKFLIATGSATSIPDISGLESAGYLTTETLFELEDQPQHLVIIGAGYIGLEVAQAYQRLGSKVTLIQRSEAILSAQGIDIAEELERQFKSEGIEIINAAKIAQINTEGGQSTLMVSTPNGSREVIASHILLAAGRKANTASLGLDQIGVKTDAKGFVTTTRGQQSSATHIFAAGDCTASPAYVYTAAYEGQLAVSNMFSNALHGHADYYGLPWVIFTDPQVAGVGMDENMAEKAEIPFEVRVLPLSEVPRAVVAKDERGFIKLIRNPETDLLLGARIVGAEAGELIMEASLAMRHSITVSQLSKTFHPYLTMSEGIKLASLTFSKDLSKLSCCAV